VCDPFDPESGSYMASIETQRMVLENRRTAKFEGGGQAQFSLLADDYSPSLR